MENIAVFVDLSSIRIGVRMLDKMCKDLSRRGTICYAKLYNYSRKRHSEFDEIIKKYSMGLATSMQGKKRVRIDIRETIDAVRIASSMDIDTIVLIASDVDGVYLIEALHSMDKHVVIAGTSESTLAEYADEFYQLDRNEEVDVEAMLSSLSHDENIDRLSARMESALCTIDNGETSAQCVAKECPLDIQDNDVCTSKVKGCAESIFPYSDVESDDIDARMEEIDRRIIAVIQDTKKRRNLEDIFRDKRN